MSATREHVRRLLAGGRERLRLPSPLPDVVLPALGLAALVLGLATPWLHVPLENSRSAWSLSVLITGIPKHSAFSYGVLVFACLVLAAVALARSGRRGPWLGLAGLAAVAVPLFFVVQAVVTDRSLTYNLTTEQAELASIVGQLGYSIPRNQLGSALFVPLTGTWQQVISALRPGWYLTAAGGALVLVAGLPGLLAALRQRLGWAAGGLGLVTLALLVTIGRGVAASAMLDAANATVQAGDYAAAMSQLNVADALNPELRSDPKEALARGQVLVATGDRTSATALLYLAQLRVSVHDEVGALALMEEAAGRDPDDRVVTATAVDQARRLAKRRQNPGILLGVVSHSWGDHVAERYMLGRILYSAGDFDAARQQLITAATEAAPDNEVASSVHTYIALCYIHLGDQDSARRELVAAIHLDTQYINMVARTVATGLYVSGSI
jgi:tetratricopeptide (TPR) repeat protein